MESRETDVCVIGGGVLGAAIAFSLSQLGKRVIVVERARPAAEASGVAMGWVLVHFANAAHFGCNRSGEFPPFLMRLMRSALDAYDDLDAEIKRESEYVQTGAMSLIYSTAERTAHEERAKLLVDHGIDVQVLSRDAVLAREPELAGDFLGATLCPREGAITSPKLVAALLERVLRMNGELLANTTVTGMIRDGARIVGVETSAGPIRAGAVVNAAGLAATEVGRLAGIEVPMFPARGQQVLLDGAGDLLHGPILCHAPARPMPGGRILLGGHPEQTGYDNRVTFAGIGQIVAEWSQVLPKCADLTFISANAGLRPLPKDGFPILGAVPGVPGLYLASLHYGVTLAPLVGRLMAELITTGTSSVPLEPFSIARFG